MRQIPLKTLRACITQELKNLPFEITSYGKVIALVSDKGLNIPVVETPKGLNNEDKGLNNSIKQDNPEKITNCNNKAKATIPTGGRQDYFKPCPK